MPLPTNLTTLDGNPLPASEIEGKVILFVNVASQCGLTPQYSGLVELDKKYGDRGFKVIRCNSRFKALYNFSITSDNELTEIPSNIVTIVY